MKLAYIVFDGITWLDLIGVYDPVSRLTALGYLPGLSWDLCAYSQGPVRGGGGLRVEPDLVRPALSGYDGIVVPGGRGVKALLSDTGFIDWLRTAESVKYKISVCTGSLLLGAAGFLQGKAATTHFGHYEELKPYCRQVLTDRIIEDGDSLTAGAVSASLDLGLYLCRKWAGEEAEQNVRAKMDYRG